VQSGTYIYGSRSGKKVIVGNHVVMSSSCMVLGEGGAHIDDYSHLGPHVIVTTQYGDSSSDMCNSRPMLKCREVRIGKGCWIGSGSVIMAGTVLGDRCIVAPNSVVYGTWKDGTQLMGNPARRNRIVINKSRSVDAHA
jgi:acetyltransferase-like isoleucine patch superfamily enzyme